jgi:uncharacterized protein with FMN-binding domain
MKRYPAVIVATVAGLAGILSFHSKGTSQLSGALPASARAGNRATTTTAGRPATGPTAAPSTTAVPPTTAPATRSALGTLEQYGYGQLAVRVTVSGSKITDAQVVGLQTDASYSQQIAVQVTPYLRREVLSVQSAQIDAISGATYTSEAYAMSVQSALDQLHIK